MIFFGFVEICIAAFALFLSYGAGVSWIESKSYKQDRTGSIILMLTVAMLLYVFACLHMMTIESSHSHWPLSPTEQEDLVRSVWIALYICFSLCVLAFTAGWYFNKKDAN